VSLAHSGKKEEPICANRAAKDHIAKVSRNRDGRRFEQILHQAKRDEKDKPLQRKTTHRACLEPPVDPVQARAEPRYVEEGVESKRGGWKRAWDGSGKEEVAAEEE
jgi:hypothetical protein